jgi:hypothetical protein
MGVTIAFDLHGKKDKKKEDVEEFNTADAGEEKSTVIDETAEGFVVRNGDDDTQGDLDNSDSSDNAAQSQQMLQGDDDDVAQEEQPVEDNPDDEDLLNQESEASVHQFEELKESVQEKMIVARPKYQEEFDSREYHIASSQPMDKPMQMYRTMKANNRK